MAQMSQWFCNELLQLSFNHAGYTPPYTALTVCLVTVVPPINVDVASLQEPVGNGYARVDIPFDTSGWVPSGYREVVTVGPTTFPTATDYWGLIEGYAIIAGAMTVAVGRLVNPLRVVTGIQPVIPAGGISIGLYDAP